MCQRIPSVVHCVVVCCEINCGKNTEILGVSRVKHGGPDVQQFANLIRQLRWLHKPEKLNFLVKSIFWHCVFGHVLWDPKPNKKKVLNRIVVDRLR